MARSDLESRVADLEGEAQEVRAELADAKRAIAELVELVAVPSTEKPDVGGWPVPGAYRLRALRGVPAVGDAHLGTASSTCVEAMIGAAGAADVSPSLRADLLAYECYVLAGARSREAQAAAGRARDAETGRARTAEAVRLLHVDDAEQAAALAAHLGVEVETAWRNREVVFGAQDPLATIAAAVDQDLAARLESGLAGGRPAVSWIHAQLDAIGATPWLARDGVRYLGHRVPSEAPPSHRVRCTALMGLRSALLRGGQGYSTRACMHIVGLGDELAGHSRLDELARRPPHEWSSVLMLPDDEDDETRKRWLMLRHGA